MYKSPISIIDRIGKQIAKQFDEDVYNAVVEVGINVDKNELIKALQYDRNQYNKGYVDGKREALESIVRCKDCAYANEDGTICRYSVGRATKPNGYCHNGERKAG